MKNNTIKLAILGSGNGTNAQQISEYFANSSDVEVACIIYNKRDAYIAERARNLGIEARYFGRKVAAYPNRIINIHPALLPAYGGKGMYGHHVHEAVVANHEKESGITIHIVDQHYDRGTTLFQARCTVEPGDTADDLAAKIHLLEKEHFPRVIDETIHAR